MTNVHNPVLEEFRAKRQVYEEFTESLFGDIKKLTEPLLKKAGIVGIERRTKDVNSFDEKHARKQYETLDKYTDLSGVRIITYLKDEMDEICKVIQSAFEIDWPNSPNKQTLLDSDRFGYRSSHYVVSYRDAWTDIPLYSRYKGMKAEIQVRTIFQHAWASIDWKLRYKGEGELPKDVERLIFRISALLETAEDDFARVTKSLSDLRAEYRSNMQHGNLGIEVNQVSLEIFVKTSETLRALEQDARNANFSISPPHPRNS